MKKYLVTTLALAVMLMATNTGCRQDTTLILKSEAAVTTKVSFSKDLVPIFSKNCALGGCHAEGGTKPDLAPGNAYSSLINGKFVDTTAAKFSILYMQLTGARTPAMPMGAAGNPSNIDPLVLAWIQQGAKNN